MKYNTVDELVDNLQEAAASDVREFVKSGLEKANAEFVAKKAEAEQKDQELKAALDNIKNFEASADKLKTKVSELEAAIKTQEDQVKFNDRMESLNEQFELDASARKSVSKRILGLSDEAFAEWLEDMKPLLKTKTEKTETEPKLEGKAAVNPPLPNSQGEGKTDKLDEWKAALSKIEVKL